MPRILALEVQVKRLSELVFELEDQLKEQQKALDWFHEKIGKA
jgi:uncharacterized coiled-coil protein SlyX